MLDRSGDLMALAYAAAQSQDLSPPPWVGPGICAGAFLLVGGMVWLKIRSTAHEARAEAAREAEFRARLQDFHPRLQYAVTVLQDQFKAKQLWAEDLKIGTPKSGRIDTWPHLAESPDPAVERDGGLRPLSPLAAQVRLTIPPGCSAKTFIDRTDAITGALNVLGTRYIRRNGNTVELELRGEAPTPDPDLLAQIDERLHPAVATLTDPWEAAKLWVTDMKIGTEATPETPADWPRLVPSPPELDPPDNGIRPMPVGAHIRVQIPGNASAENFTARTGNLVSSFDAKDVTVVYNDGKVVCLELRVTNPLGDMVLLPEHPETPVDLENLRVGKQEDGEYYRLAIRGTHLLLGGITGSGKSSGLWSIIAAIAPAVLAGVVQIHMIDLKRGTEMSAGYKLYESWARKPKEAIQVLEKMVLIMRERADEYTEVSMETGRPMRKHVPRPGDPHHVLIIDEILMLLKIASKTTVVCPDIPNPDGEDISTVFVNGKERENLLPLTVYAGALLLELLSQARAIGVTVIAATQNAAKEIMELLRDMIPTLIGLRQASVEQERMMFGPGARERGVRATEITVDEAGTVFVDQTETGRAATRARFFYVDDDDIQDLVRTYGRKQTLALEAAPAAAKVITMDDHRPGVDLDKPVPARCKNPNCKRGDDGRAAELVGLSPTGRPKEYCDDACRQAAKRARVARGRASSHPRTATN
ncbi:FtsK/SpoIIIE domain-containing protein [Nocardia brasiliensis]|uniref:FtsK/SpoIIIE domain-containing protein n=1 Tax=Nocardia brasiliensis TaxID=37326 RepID=UPI0024573BF0|nr:FtsK/SpoIIIE domain-containing protein [Nocardia brasiliensis]